MKRSEELIASGLEAASTGRANSLAQVESAIYTLASELAALQELLEEQFIVEVDRRKELLIVLNALEMSIRGKL